MVTAGNWWSEAAPGPLGLLGSQFPQSSALDLPECAQEGRAKGKGRDVPGLVEGPVEGSKGPSQHTLAQGQYPVDGPE